MVDKAWHANECVENYFNAKGDKQWKTCAIQLHHIGEALGVFVDRKDIRIHAKFERISDEDLLKQLQDVTEQVRIAKQEDGNE